MNRIPFLIRIVACVAPLAFGVASCNPNDAAIGALTVSTTTNSGAAVRPTTTTGGSITISSAKVVLSTIRLAVAGTPCDMENETEDAMRMSSDVHEADDSENDADDNEKGCEQVEVGPVTVNLPLDASTKLVLDALVPAGTYTGVHAKLESVNVSGTFTDAGGTAHPFTFALDGKAVIEIHLPAPITLGPTTSNVTIMVDVASWFKDASGAVLDPTNQSNAGAIDRNIRRSFRAFADHDRDGVDDDHEEGHDGHD